MSSNETTLKCKPKRYLWVDNLKMFACLLVVIGHLYMSMMAGGWIRENNILYCWPIQTVYTFHVPLFFVCSDSRAGLAVKSLQVASLSP